MMWGRMASCGRLEIGSRSEPCEHFKRLVSNQPQDAILPHT